MSDDCAATPLIELARSVPRDLRAEWESQWWPDGTPCGHSMAPVGRYLHDMADRIEKLERVFEAAKIHMRRGPQGGGGVVGSSSALRQAIAAAEGNTGDDDA